MSFLIDIVGLAGLGLVAFGFHSIYPPASFIVIGSMLLLYAIYSSRARTGKNN